MHSLNESWLENHSQWEDVQPKVKTETGQLLCQLGPVGITMPLRSFSLSRRRSEKVVSRLLPGKQTAVDGTRGAVYCRFHGILQHHSGYAVRDLRVRHRLRSVRRCRVLFLRLDRFVLVPVSTPKSITSSIHWGMLFPNIVCQFNLTSPSPGTAQTIYSGLTLKPFTSNFGLALHVDEMLWRNEEI